MTLWIRHKVPSYTKWHTHMHKGRCVVYCVCVCDLSLLLYSMRAWWMKKRFVINHVICANQSCKCESVQHPTHPSMLMLMLFYYLHLLGGKGGKKESAAKEKVSENREKEKKKKKNRKREGKTQEARMWSESTISFATVKPKGMWTKTSAHGHRAHARVFHFSPFEF